MTSVFLIDDHTLLRNAMAELVNRFEGFTVCGEAANGKEFVEWLGGGIRPDIVILDIQMPHMNGEETAKWIGINNPNIKILVLSMYDDELNIIRMLRAGAGGYILKDVKPQQLLFALSQLRDFGFCHSDLVNNALKRVAISGLPGADLQNHKFTLRELEFIKLACTDLTYKEIAGKMNCAVRTVDGYRDEVFVKLGIKSRIGLALYALRKGLVKI